MKKKKARMKEAMLYEKLDGKVRCALCSHRCTIPSGGTGFCGVRRNVDGKLYSLVYGKLVASSVDPIEKKPFFNYLPGSRAYSIATVGCNFRCLNCQNADISQAPRMGYGIPGSDVSPGDVVRAAGDMECKSIAYTYVEPTIFFEYSYDISILAKKKGIRNLYVTNGYMTEEMLEVYHPYLDAASVDLKSFSDKFYREVCGARLEPVLDALKSMRKKGIWIEVTTLVIPGMNDSIEELKSIASFIRDELGAEVPWHISRFHPDYKMLDTPPTPPETIHKARGIGVEAGLRYVYTGNLPGDPGTNTYCFNCNELAIKRDFYNTENLARDGKCPACGKKLDIVGL